MDFFLGVQLHFTIDLKDLIRNLSKNKSADAQILMWNYMIERFLERMSLSEYRDKIILKGGMLVAAMVGLDARSTMAIDATVKGATVGIEEVENMIASIVSVPLDDGVEFRLKRISEIMDETEYPGIRVSMETEFDGVVTPLKIDISTGDAITPREVRYSFKLMLEDRSIEIWAYNLETVLAEKLETAPVPRHYQYPHERFLRPAYSQPAPRREHHPYRPPSGAYCNGQKARHREESIRCACGV